MTFRGCWMRGARMFPLHDPRAGKGRAHDPTGDTQRREGATPSVGGISLQAIQSQGTRHSTGSTAPALRDCISRRIPPSCVTLSPPVATRHSPAPPSRGHRARGKGAGKRVIPWDETLWDKMRARPKSGTARSRARSHQDIKANALKGSPKRRFHPAAVECWGTLGRAGSATHSCRPLTPLYIRHPLSELDADPAAPDPAGSRGEVAPAPSSRPGVGVPQIWGWYCLGLPPTQLDPVAVQAADPWGSQWNGIHVRAKENLGSAPQPGRREGGSSGRTSPTSSPGIRGEGDPPRDKPSVSSAIY